MLNMIIKIIKKFKALGFFILWLAAPSEGEDRLLPVGGQAVIEGVLMKGHKRWGLSVREPGGGIWRTSWKLSTWPKRGLWAWPVIRGLATMADMMKNGYKALTMSSEIALGEQEQKLSTKETLGAVAVAVVLAVGLFLLLPLWLAEKAGSIWQWGAVSVNIWEGVFRGLVFIAYVTLMGLWHDTGRVFEYHGAEHKTVNAYEQKAEMTVHNIKRFSRIHRRCGTSFLLVVIVVSIIVFGIAGSGGILWRIASRIILLPIVVGLSYEFIKAASKSSGIMQKIMSPALLLQYITTKEPTTDQIEVALDALNTAMK